MAAKTTTKKTPTKKVAKKKARKAPARKQAARKRATRTSRATEGPVFSENMLCAAMHRKIMAVRAECPKPPQTGTYIEEGADRTDEYPYTRASEIFATYHELMATHGLDLTPCACTSREERGWYSVDMVWQLTDLETGYSELKASSGTGNNSVWGVLSAQTVARKQALLMIFHATWECDMLEERMLRQAARDGSGRNAPERMIRAVEGVMGSIQRRVDEIPIVVARTVSQQIKNFDWKSGGKK